MQPAGLVPSAFSTVGLSTARHRAQPSLDLSCPARSGCSRSTTAMSARQSPPSATAAARSAMTFPGSRTARAPATGPGHRTDPSQAGHPHCLPQERRAGLAPGPRPSADTVTLELRALFFTGKVPSAGDGQDLRQTLFFQVKGAFSCNRTARANPRRRPEPSWAIAVYALLRGTPGSSAPTGHTCCVPATSSSPRRTSLRTRVQTRPYELVVRVDGAAPPELPQLNEPVIAFFSYSDANNQYARTVARITGRATRRNRLRHADERTGLDLIAVLTAGGAATPATAHRAAACSCPAACTAPTRCCSAARAVKAPRPLPPLSEVVRTIHKAA